MATASTPIHEPFIKREFRYTLVLAGDDSVLENLTLQRPEGKPEGTVKYFIFKPHQTPQHIFSITHEGVVTTHGKNIRSQSRNNVEILFYRPAGKPSSQIITFTITKK